jgi:hypothetical protein
VTACTHRDLAALALVAPSASGAYVFCLCRCGVRRVLPRALWEEEQDRQAKEARIQEAAQLLGRTRQAHSYPQIEVQQGPELACCNAWHPVTTLPFLCPTCGRAWLWEGQGATRVAGRATLPL